MDAVLHARQAEIRDARRLIGGWAGEVRDWLDADARMTAASERAVSLALAAAPGGHLAPS
jgi:hypothetical protein